MEAFKIFDFIVIGGGIAGISAIEQVRLLSVAWVYFNTCIFLNLDMPSFTSV